MQDDIAVAYREVQLLADLGSLELEEFSHHEDAGRIFRQMLKAGVKDLPETLFA